MAFCLYLMFDAPLEYSQFLIATAIVMASADLAARPLLKIGVALPGLVAPVAAAVMASHLDFVQRAPLAYIIGTVGLLAGSDLLHLRDKIYMGLRDVSIAGAGSFDGVFLMGLIAVLLA